jgi:nucleoside-diphosphate-sugar epimerase
MSRVLVTGAAGFIGRALVSDLLAFGHDVTAVVRNPATTRRWNGPVRVVAADIDGATDWQSALDGIEWIAHLAGIAHQPFMEEAATAARYRAVNLDGTAALARAAASTGVRRLLFLSSVKVNGERTGQDPFTERDVPAPEDIYGRTKWQAEQALARIARESALEFTVLRSPLVYGPGVGGNFASLLRLCDTPLPLPLGAIDNRRSMIARANLTQAIMTCFNHPAAANGTFLVRDGDDLSTPDLVRHLRQALGRPARLLPIPPACLTAVGRISGRSNMMSRLVGSLAIDDRLLREKLGWVPPVRADHALAETARAFRASPRS